MEPEEQLGTLSLSSIAIGDGSDEGKASEYDKERKNCLCDRSHWFYRYAILGLLCVVSIAFSFNSELTVGLSKALIEVMDIDALTYEYLEGFGTVPDIAICAIGGYMIDRYIRIGYGFMGLTVVGLVGEIMLCAGVFFSQFWMMVLGTIIVFAAQKLLEIIVFMYQVKWFRDKELTFALALNCSARYIGLTLSIALSNPFYEFLSFIPSLNVRLGMACLLGPTAAILSILCSIIVVILDWDTKETVTKKPVKNDETFDCKEKLYELYKYISLNVALLAVAMSTYYSVIDSFVTIGELLFIRKFRLNANLAALANSLPFGINIILLPVTGLAIDVIGYHVWWSLIGVLLALGTHFLLLVSSRSFAPFIAQIMYAVSDSLFASSMGPLPAYVVPESQEGTVYGIIRSFNNFLFVVSVFATGLIADTGRYDMLELFYILQLVFTFASMSALLVLDTAADVGIINISGRARRDKGKVKEKSLESPSLSYDENNDVLE